MGLAHPICCECVEVWHVQRRCPGRRKERETLNPNPRPRTLFRSSWGMLVFPGVILSKYQPTLKCYAGPNPREVIVDVQTMQAPAGVGRPLDRPDRKGLNSDQRQQFQGLI
ncbi:hypothetical protein SKAU_G00398320 [Synaphobranchus kaupii]|uniref:Uncharacterized protein n=1 Tax=Synaphobranchus kaupii TaxID=118154 RepID=A0A9Q1E8I3_SYNKA|nr:hypothetical protein SKAU_G00398320 [Synaphobranchus kaupii]